MTSTQGIETVRHLVSDLAEAKAVYSAVLDVGGGRLVATDLDGNGLGLLRDR